MSRATRLFFIPIFTILIGLAFAPRVVLAAGDHGTADEAKAMVEKAVAYLKQVGPEKAFAAFGDKSNKDFHDRDLYVFVRGMDGNTVAHGVNPGMIGHTSLESQGRRRQALQQGNNRRRHRQGYRLGRLSLARSRHAQDRAEVVLRGKGGRLRRVRRLLQGAERSPARIIRQTTKEDRGDATVPRFDDYSIRLKMFLAPSFLLAALVGFAVYTLVLLNSNERHLTELSDGAFQRAMLVGALDSRLNALHAHLYRLTSIASNDTSTERKQTAADALTKEIAEFPQALKAVDEACAGDAETAPLLQALGKTMKSYIDAGQQVITMAAFDAATASIFMGNADQTYGEAGKEIAQLDSIVQSHKTEMIAGAHQEIGSARIIYLAALAIVSLIAIGAVWVVSNRISRPVVVMAGVMRKLAGGELATETPYAGRKDEIGAIAAAVQVFKETAVEAERMTAERERQRAEQQRHAERLPRWRTPSTRR